MPGLLPRAQPALSARRRGRGARRALAGRPVRGAPGGDIYARVAPRSDAVLACRCGRMSPWSWPSPARSRAGECWSRAPSKKRPFTVRARPGLLSPRAHPCFRPAPAAPCDPLPLPALAARPGICRVAADGRGRSARLLFARLLPAPHGERSLVTPRVASSAVRVQRQCCRCPLGSRGLPAGDAGAGADSWCGGVGRGRAEQQGQHGHADQSAPRAHRRAVLPEAHSSPPQLQLRADPQRAERQGGRRSTAAATRAPEARAAVLPCGARGAARLPRQVAK